jgi:ABC-type oligopeptide transport system substrate-binding subunit
MQEMIGRRAISLLVLCAGLALLASAAFAAPRSGTQRGGTLRLMFGAEPDSLDPALATTIAGSWTLLYATCAKLFNVLPDPATGRPHVAPEVVRSFRVSDGGRTYTFELKRTFRFHTGEPVTARSFADAFNRTANPQMNSAAVRLEFFAEISGAEAFRTGKAGSISGVQVLGRYRLRIRLTRRAGDFIARLTMPFFCPVQPGTPITPRGIEVPPGSGPYYIDERLPEERIVLKRNPYYPRGVRTVNPDRIVWTIETDRAERVRATERNENDFTFLFAYPDAVVRDLREKYGLNRPGGQLLRLPTLAKNIFAFNPQSPVFEGAGTAALRKAINYVLDRLALTRNHGYLAGRRSDRLLPAVLSESRRLYPIHGSDPITGRRWLARSKSPPKTLTLYTTTFPDSVANAQEFTRNLKQLGIEVDVKQFEFRALLGKLTTREEPWDVTWLATQAWYPDPGGLFLPLLRGTRYAARVDVANRLSGAARAKAWAELETDIMRNDPPAAVYADSMSLNLLSRSFGCFRWVPVYDVDLAAACKK